MNRHSVFQAREGSLVDIQCLLQKALNETFGNPRDFEDKDPKKTERLFKEQRLRLVDILSCKNRDVKELFADDSKSSVKDFAGALHALGYDLKLKIKKRTI